ncbi:hypothetical protein RNI52_13630 [Labrys neptuniae]|uniref:hypothetical protein n=1 Tax=Labrys neptuniae TaxID=376174 RepID=UPI00288CDC8F|nr:hypothetical protein [Labrys neptuniae]MDT3378366.1 hypothetical protein [Labrys neptuniae]
MSSSPASLPRGGRIVLTASAKAFADRAGILAALVGVELPLECMVGDWVTVSGSDFAVMRRRWVLVDEVVSLEITLDHPAGRGLR